MKKNQILFLAATLIIGFTSAVFLSCRKTEHPNEPNSESGSFLPLAHTMKGYEHVDQKNYDLLPSETRTVTSPFLGQLVIIQSQI